ncbi:hypothetical protein H8356DRAFT_1742956 [Neocallimastix lanati (nom. inval.)]|jgi:hypothetical protein|nr:hypothetical protein H8356DRAFT_1742956 [Neocallimastix sp. JGI-2020a]
MKFFGIVVTLIAAVSSVFGTVCHDKCDASKVPKKALSAPLQLVAVVDQNNASIKYQIGGNVTINDDCHFSVENFYVLPGGGPVRWVGALLNSNEGTSLTKEVPLSPIDPNQPQTIKYDVNEADAFCKVSLLNDVGRISLMDTNWQLIAFADVNPDNDANKPNNNGGNSSDATTAKWSMGLLGLSSLLAYLLA